MGKRDYVIVAVLVGCARRREVLAVLGAEKRRQDSSLSDPSLTVTWPISTPRLRKAPTVELEE
jgi:hypothetical protein